MENEYKTWKFFKNILEEVLKPDTPLDYAFFRQFRPRFIRDPHTGKLERCIKISDIAKYISEVVKKEP